MTTDTMLQVSSMPIATPSTLSAETTHVSDADSNSERYEDLLRENARLVKALEEATAAGFMVPDSLGESITPQVTSPIVTSPNPPVLEDILCTLSCSLFSSKGDHFNE